MLLLLLFFRLLPVWGCHSGSHGQQVRFGTGFTPVELPDMTLPFYPGLGRH